MAVDNATILDKVRLRGTDDYQQRIPSATQTGVANTMRYLFDPMNRQYLNDCVWSMVNRIGLTVMAQNEPFENPLAVFKKRIFTGVRPCRRLQSNGLRRTGTRTTRKTF